MVLTLINDRLNANKARQTQLFMQLYDRFDDKDFQRQWMEVIYQWEREDYDDFERKYGSGNLEAFSSSFSVAAYFEGIWCSLKEN